MKKILLTVFMAVCGLQMSAQQNLFVAQDLESAIVNKDNTVTFNFKAPDAQKVQIAGDFAEKAEGQHIGGMVGAGLIDMTKNSEGIWTYTTKPLDSELYSYEFMVDGVPTIDPNNVYVYRDFATTSNVFIVGNGKADLYKVNKVPHGTLAHRWYHSDGMKWIAVSISTRRQVMNNPVIGSIRYSIYCMVWEGMKMSGQLLDVLHRFSII